MSDHLYKSGEAAQNSTGTAQRQVKTILTGREKAAILLGEIGTAASEQMLKYFTDSEIHTLRRAMEGLGKRVNVQNEVQVLEETLKYGMMHRLTDVRPEIFDKSRYSEMVAKENMSPFAKAATEASPQDVANVLRSWLNDNSPTTRR